MWILLLILLNTPATVLEHFTTEQACMEVRDRVERDMRKSYPEFDFRVVCAYHERVTPPPTLPAPPVIVPPTPH